MSGTAFPWDKNKRRGSSSTLWDVVRTLVAAMMVLMVVRWWCFGAVLPFSFHSGLPSPKRLLWSQQTLAPVSTKAFGMAERNPRVLMISASQAFCGTSLGDNNIMKSLKNKADYARRHGMDTWFSLELLVDPAYHRLRNKILLIRHVLRTQRNYDWYIWIDSDAMITDMNFRIPWEQYRGYSLVMWGDGPSLDTEPHFTRSLNTGVVFYRNDYYSRNFLDEMVKLWDSNPNQTELHSKVTGYIKGMTSFLCDQATVLYLLVTQKEQWINRVYLEERFHINRYWKPSAFELDSFMEPDAWKGDGNSPPFVVHFCGCSLCFKKFTDDFEECQRQHERAFNFANNQIIREFGFMHRNLSSSEVVPIHSAQTAQG
ncbi:hypothetical protein CBR_g37963 [Chara braunii]|uniref:GT34-family glycosyltransferase n=1 Tax=Chara braunii TaxID=69332 RepID=A0A388LP37_CHABU|nr:hypothetical protein CBR_g37963 [Chara braunii]|eukprot:GBG84088.1 hypothetical protein CBR_g37963 [Chara braunii]